MRLFPLALVLVGTVLAAQEPQWFVAEARSIRVLSNASAAAASRSLGELASAELLFRNLVGATPGRPVHAFAVKDAASLREVAPQFWERRGIRPRALAYAGPYAAFLAVREDLAPAERQEALFHEYVHLLTAAQAPDAPAWLDEGLSEFWGTVSVEGERAVIGRPIKKHIARLQRWEPLQRTLRRPRGEFIVDSEPAEMFYAQSWAMVHYLLLGRGHAPLSLLPDFRSLPPDFDSILRDYLSSGDLKEVSLPFTPHPSYELASSIIPEARALAERAHMLVFGPRPAAAIALAKRALTLEPRDALGLEVMGTYYFLHNKPDEARTWLGRAFDTRSASPAASVYLALLASSPLDRERFLMAAVNAAPDLEVAWQRLFDLYRGDGRLEAVRDLCHRARRAVPWLSLATVPECA